MLSTLKKINFLITKRQRKGLVILAFLLFVGMILEVFGIGILVPALSVLLDDNYIMKVPLLYKFKLFLGDVSERNFLMLFLTIIVFIYLIKSIFLIYLTFKQNKLISRIIETISNRLYKNYLKSPYEFHLNNNSSVMIKNIQVEVHYLYIYIFSFLTVVVELSMVFAITCVLLYIEPIGAISIGLFYAFLSIIFLRFTKLKLSKWGAVRQELDSNLSKIVTESFGAIKELIVLNKSNFFVDYFYKINHQKFNINAKQSSITQVPRFYLEFISVVGLISFILFMLFLDYDITSLFTVLGVFVAATFRMIPSINRVISALQSIKFYSNSINTIYDEINNISTLKFSKSETSNVTTFKNCVVFSNVSYKYPGKKEILKNVNLKISKGERVGIIGESGSGKSTLISLLLGLHLPTSGNVLLDNTCTRTTGNLLKPVFGYVSQSIYLLDDSIVGNIALGVNKSEIDHNHILEIIKKVRLESFISNLKDGLNTNVGERGVKLSGGQIQRLGLARALYGKPQILILDEATSSLDSHTEKALMESVYDLDRFLTIIMIAHRESTLSECNSIYKVIEGKIVKKK